MSTSLPLVSIVIPSYNHGRYLAATIDSVLAQDYPRVELIVIDDGSTDDSPQVLARYTGRFHWEAQPNQGQVVALNRGWDMSRGEIIGWIGADDLLLPDAVSASVRCFRENPGAVCTYCDFEQIDANDLPIRRVRAPDFNYREMVVRHVCPPGPGALFLRSAYRAVGPWDARYRIMLDYDYWLRLGLHGPFVHIPRVLARYRVHEGQETFSRMDPQKVAEPVLIITRLYERGGLPADVAALKDRALSTAHLISAQLHFRAGRPRDGFRSTRQAFALCPRNLFTWKVVRLAGNVLLNRMVYRFIWRMNSLMRR